MSATGFDNSFKISFQRMKQRKIKWIISKVHLTLIRLICRFATGNKQFNPKMEAIQGLGCYMLI